MLNHDRAVLHLEVRAVGESSRSLLVAIIDDDASVRRSLARLLESAGLRATTFASAQQYLECSGRRAVDCLVVDVHLGGMGGFELREILSAAGDDTPTVFMTAFDDASTRERAQLMGAAGYLRKPFEASPLLETVFTAVDRHLDSGREGRA
jgi:FixJ family two-component response regulator